MNRRSPLSIHLNRASSDSLQQQLYLRLLLKIQSGAIASGECLPSTRELALDLGISRNTVIAAYDRLLGEGYLTTRERSGVFVHDQLNLQKPPHPLSEARWRPRSVTTSDQESVLRGPLPFRPSQPDVRLFPIETWNRLRNRAIRKLGSGLLHYQSRFALGLPSLRHSLAAYLREHRGVQCDWHQIAITSGSQHALYMLSQLLLHPKDTVWMEDPGYLGARRAFEGAGAKMLPVKIDPQGAVPPADLGQARFVYTTPSRQYPTGICMPIARRMLWLERVHSSNAWLIEDDYDSEFRYTRAPVPSLHSLDAKGRVLYIGSMSKVLFPSLRIGYIVLSPELVEPFTQLRWVLDDHGPLIDQATLASFIDSGKFYTHIRRCRKAYGNRLETFLQSAEKLQLPLQFPNADGGMNQAGFFRDPKADSQELSKRLGDAGLDIPSLQQFAIRRTASGLLFGFTAFEPETIVTNMAKVGRVLGRQRT